MEIDDLKMYRLRNDEHFWFHAETKDLSAKQEPEALGMQQLFAAYAERLDAEDASLKKIVKSEFTQQLMDADAERDEAWRGLAETCYTSLRRANPEVKAAATRVKIPIDTYGNIAGKPYNEQTSATYNILQDLNSEKYLADAIKAGLSPWMEEMQAANAKFDRIMKERFSESAAKSDVTVKAARARVDEAYYDIIRNMNARIVLNGIGAFEPFIRGINALVKKYDLIVKTRLGRSSAKAAKKEGQGEQNEEEGT